LRALAPQPRSSQSGWFPAYVAEGLAARVTKSVTIENLLSPRCSL